MELVKSDEAAEAAQRGMKHDAGKPMAGLMVSDFANALLAVAEVSTFGAKKYAPHSWVTVPNARERYNDALYRHLFLAAAGEAQDQESDLLHAAHVAWNALALLELEIRKADPKPLGSIPPDAQTLVPEAIVPEAADGHQAFTFCASQHVPALQAGKGL